MENIFKICGFNLMDSLRLKELKKTVKNRL